MRILSGIQPTGNLHLGNYLGAIRNWVRMQDEVEASGGDSLYFLADLHALSQPHVPAKLAANTREMAAAVIACGIDPERSILFNQAQVPAHAELQWLLSGTARFGWLSRMTQFKDKAGKNRDSVSSALFTYPVLQAADVLLYQATHVPVGEDQKQHLELARDIAQKFNNDFGAGKEIFTLPQPIIPPGAARIMSLRDGSAKMSKSDPSDMSRINLSDDANAIMAKVRKAKSDADALPVRPPGWKVGPRPPIWSVSMRRLRGKAWCRYWRNSPARALAPSSRRWASCWWKNWRRSTRVSSNCGRIARRWTLSCAPVPQRLAHWPPRPWMLLTRRWACCDNRGLAWQFSFYSTVVQPDSCTAITKLGLCVFRAQVMRITEERRMIAGRASTYKLPFNPLNWLRLAFAGMMLTALAACATNFDANVTRFQSQLPPPGQSFAVVADDPACRAGLNSGNTRGWSLLI